MTPTGMRDLFGGGQAFLALGEHPQPLAEVPTAHLHQSSSLRPWPTPSLLVTLGPAGAGCAFGYSDAQNIKVGYIQVPVP